MSSILTNSSAMVALETLRGINKGMNMVQNEISTGKKVSNAKDNAAVYAISTVMSSDVASFDKISESLNLGSATVGVARAASEQVVDLLTEMKTLIVSAQEDNVDRSKIQTDVAALKSSIDNIVSGSQFNGQNLINNGGSINVLASLDRDSNGAVSATNITVNKTNLGTGAAVAASAATAEVAATAMSDGDGGFAEASATSIANSGGTATVSFDFGAISEGDVFEITIAGTAYEYTALATDDMEDAATGLKAVIDAANITNLTSAVTANATPTTTATVITFTNAATSGTAPSLATESTAAVVPASAAVEAKTEGGLLALSTMDVSSSSGATSALAAIDGLLSTAIDAASSFGSAQKQIDVQNDFVSSLTDAMKVGIGAMVDADMEEASARLQSLQVQQQLGVQALSIANQAPQSLLSLFR